MKILVEKYSKYYYPDTNIFEWLNNNNLKYLFQHELIKRTYSNKIYIYSR